MTATASSHHARRETLALLRARLAGLEAAGTGPPDSLAPVTLDRGPLDRALGGGLARGAVHELHAAPAHGAVLIGFSAALATLAAGATRPVLWARSDHAGTESGGLNGEGLALFGLDPATVVTVAGSNALAVLRAGAEGARCPALGAVVIELWGEAKALDLTATRRLALAAARSGVTVLLARAGGTACAGSAALTRWQVAPVVSRSLALDAPGHPAFRLALARHRHGVPGGPWCVEWNSDARCFGPPLSGDLAAPASDRPAAPRERPLVRLAG